MNNIQEVVILPRQQSELGLQLPNGDGFAAVTQRRGMPVEFNIDDLDGVAETPVEVADAADSPEHSTPRAE